MTIETITALVTFAFVTSITPGPNNMMLMASGANFGLIRTVPHMLGVAIGFFVMLVLVGIGLMQVFLLYPAAEVTLKILSVLYMLFLAWKIATAAAPRQSDASGTPMSFLQAALFQWVNPKAWAMALSAVAAYAPSHSLGAVVTVGLVFGVVSLPAISVWTLLGQEIRRILTNQLRLRIFNAVMAILLVLSLYPVLFPGMPGP